MALLAAAMVGLSAQAQVPRAKGWVREPAHVKAALPLMLRFQAWLPEEVDLAAQFPPPGNQGRQSSCTAWATGYAMRSYYEGRRRHWDFSSPRQMISPAYIYNRLHGFGGNCDAGTSISEALDLLKTVGAPTLSAYPYVEDDCARPAGPDLARTGAEFRIAGWTALDNKRLDDAKGQLAQGHPVVFGMDVSQRFETLSGRDVYDDTTAPRTGGHAMVLVGYSERRQAFKVMNSWGTQWGDGGFGWVSYRAVRQLSDLMFVMDVPVSAPPAPPPPPPPPPAPAPAPEPAPAPAPAPLPVPVPVPAPAPEPAPAPPPAPVPAPMPMPVPVPPPEPTPVPAPTPSPAPTPPVVVDVPPAPPPAPVVVPRPAPRPPVIVAPPVPTPVVIPPVAQLQAQIATRIQAVACAKIDASLGTDRVVRLSGFAGSADDIATLQSDLLALPGVRRVESQLLSRPWPQCEVYLNFANELKTPRGLAARLHGAAAQVFSAGDSLSIEVVTPSYPSYLYVTYLQASGDALNLVWPQGRYPKALPPGTRLRLGGGAGGEPVYRVTAPFGNEVVVVVASASPLFPDEPPETATNRDVLTSFRRSFLLRPAGGGGSRMVSAIAVPLTTRPKP